MGAKIILCLKPLEIMTYISGLQTFLAQGPQKAGYGTVNNLIRLEDKLAVITGYNVKLVEQSGVLLSRLWKECPACREFDGKGGSRCRLSNVIYEGTCMTCEDKFKAGKREKLKIGRYIGESSRTLAERSSEHERGAHSLDTDNFIVKLLVLENTESQKSTSY